MLEGRDLQGAEGKGADVSDLRKVTEALVSSGFTDLSDVKFSVRWASMKDAFARVFPCRIGRRGHGGGAFGKRYVVSVDACFVGLPVEVVAGVLAHELGHVVEQRRRFANTDRQKALRGFFLSAGEEDFDQERAADLQAVLAGFGEELAACYKMLDQEWGIGGDERPNGLSLEEIDVLNDLLEEGFQPDEVVGLIR